MPRGQQKIGNFKVPAHHEFPRLLQWLVSSEQATKYELQYFGSEIIYGSSAKSVFCEPGQTRALGNVSSLALISGVRQETIVKLVESAAIGEMIVSYPLTWIQLASAFQAFDQAGNPIVDPWSGRKVVFYDYEMPSDQIVYAHDQLRSWYEAPFLTPIEQHLSLFVKSLEQPTFKPVTRSEVEMLQKSLELLVKNGKNQPSRHSDITRLGDTVDTPSKGDESMCLSAMISDYMTLHGIDAAEALALHLLATVSRSVNPSQEPIDQEAVDAMTNTIQSFLDESTIDEDCPGFTIVLSHLSFVLRNPETGQPFYGNTVELKKFHRVENCTKN